MLLHISDTCKTPHFPSG